ncbi:proton-coupled amino acid transporter-like protein CG1139 [Zootermopsis nevadensis]|uniref:Proton-coupled amino acid transporter 1 n=1 Tax=Zootermopsis nevadensis TaxID=136037 RepID=A0A067RLL7_ZOONE|nr:proton-coupled amino acid transporter-like protein CG1139 [Zootermopsis nevadensis]XP_021915829.1 proton-coupled amino acid transporter-like protein CG1139 [Zootermopsis nevadensis]KDR21505.1 Proton-coupled amino acid transporter 1 [Zootermopsis nevadensis]
MSHNMAHSSQAPSVPTDVPQLPRSGSLKQDRRKRSVMTLNLSGAAHDFHGKRFSCPDIKVSTPHHGGVFTIEIPESRKASRLEVYEPQEHRNVAYPTTNTETLLHLLKGSLGTGILAMPNAFYRAGYVLGAAGTLFIGFVCTYCIHQLVKSELELCKRRRIASLNYPDTASAAMEDGPGIFQKCAPYAGHVVNTFLIIYQLGTCCVYVVFVSSNIKEVVDEYHEPKLDLRLYMAMLLLPLILINWVRNLKYLAPFTTLANCLTFIGFGITLYYVFVDIPHISTRNPVGTLRDFPLFFGIVLFALEAIGVILPLENNMKTPKSFGGKFGVLNISMVLIIILYVGMGLFGYMKYGSGALGSITLNLPTNEILAQSVRVMLAVAIFVTHGLQCYVAVDITWNHYMLPKMEKCSQKILLEYIVRTSLVLVTFLLAVAIPNLELFISLFGALCLAALGIAFPAIIETSTFWYSINRSSSFYSMLARNTFLVIFSLFGLVVGTYTSLSDIIHTFFT